MVVIELETVMMEGSRMMRTDIESIIEKVVGLPMDRTVVEEVTNQGLVPATNAVKMATFLESVPNRKMEEISVAVVVDPGAIGGISEEKEGAMGVIEEMIPVVVEGSVHLVIMQQMETLAGTVRVGQEQEELGRPAGECREISA